MSMSAEVAGGVGCRWSRDPLKTSIGSAGRIVMPKPLRDALGLALGSTVGGGGSSGAVTPTALASDRELRFLLPNAT